MRLGNQVILVAGDLQTSNTRVLVVLTISPESFFQCASSQNPVCLLSQAKIIENNRVIKRGTAWCHKMPWNTTKILRIVLQDLLTIFIVTYKSSSNSAQSHNENTLRLGRKQNTKFYVISTTQCSTMNSKLCFPFSRITEHRSHIQLTSKQQPSIPWT